MSEFSIHCCCHGHSIPRLRREFPYINAEGNLNQCRCITWHWHPEPQFLRVTKGVGVFHTPQREIAVPAGSMVFINGGALHDAVPQDVTISTHYQSSHFSRSFLTQAGSTIDLRYCAPVLNCQELDMVLIEPDTPTHRRMLELAQSAYEQADRKDFLYELSVQSLIAELWRLFVSETHDIWKHATQKNDSQNERLRQMLQFILENYGEKLTLNQIASSAGISRRECARCFQTMLHTTPFEYLNDCRVHMAAAMLTESQSSITDIALSCGFNSSSYFGQVFLRSMDMTPTEYRRRYAQQGRAS